MTRRNFGLLALGTVAGEAPASAAEDIFEVIVAPATAENPRNDEGDILALKDGTLLAAWSDFYAGARRDASPARISAARSSDGGHTWSQRFCLQENTGARNVMSPSLLRTRSGVVLFFYGLKNSNTEHYPMVRRSVDECRSWSAAERVAEVTEYFATMNARVLQLRAGRIVLPLCFTPDISDKNQPLQTVMYLSDNDGRTWRRGKTRLACPPFGAMEPGVVELRDGRLLQIIRTRTGRIWHSHSADGGDTWTEAKPWMFDSPEAPSTLTRMPGGELLLVYNPVARPDLNHFGPRTPLVASISRDDGKTWSPSKTIEGDPKFGYSYTSVTFHRGRALLAYYVMDGTPGPSSWKLKSIPLAWLLKATPPSK